MDKDKIRVAGDELYAALSQRRTIPPLTERYDAMSIEDAYHVSLQMLERRKAAGETVIGKKIGVTSEVVQKMLNVHQPDFGFLTDTMLFHDGQDVPISQHLTQARAEGEIAFKLKSGLAGPGVTNDDVLAATETVMPCFEIVDSRIDDWRIKIQDTIADNASCGLFVINEQAAIAPDAIDLAACRMLVEKNGAPLSEGTGAAALGSPVNCVTWLANTLGELGMTLDAGDIILSGSLVPLEPVQAGDHMIVRVDGMGDCRVQFT